jgi:hypothetical protein
MRKTQMMGNHSNFGLLKWLAIARKGSEASHNLNFAPNISDLANN